MIWVYEISNYLKKFTNEIKTPRTSKADIIFKIKGRKYGIEVETGKVPQTRLKTKVENLKKDLGKNWFFFVTNLHLKKRYQRFGDTFDNRGIKKKISSLFKK